MDNNYVEPEDGDTEGLEDEDIDQSLAFDADAAIAVQAEAQLKKIPVKLGGKWWLFPHHSDWEIEVGEAFNDGYYTEAIQLLFPDADDIADLVAKVPNKVAEKLLKHVMKKSGVDLGKSQRSQKSSKKDRKR